MEDEERAHRDAHFQEELKYLKANVVHLTSLLEQTLRNASGEDLSNRPAIFIQPPAIAQLEETMSEHGQEPPYNPAFVHSMPPAPTPAVIDPFANESYDMIDMTKKLMSSPKCKSVEVINNSARPRSNHREVNCINYK